MVGAIELPGVVDVVPDAVESSHDCGFRCHECIGKPDCKDGVLLSEGLSGCDLAHFLASFFDFRGNASAWTVSASDVSAHEELERATYEGSS